jgi:O-antigen/teichoic acid export membrane protein
MHIKASRKDIVWNYLGTIFSMSSSFLLLPFVMLKLTGDELGLWYIFLSINGLVMLFDFGFDPTFGRNIAYAWSGASKLKKTGADFSNGKSGPNYRLLNILITTSKKIYGLISAIAFLMVATVGTIYVFQVSRNISGNNHIIAWMIFSVSLFVNLYMGYFSALLRGVGAVAVINRSMIFSKLAQLVVSVVLLFCGFKLIAVSVGFLLNGFVYRYLCKYGFYQYKNIGKNLEKLEEKVTSKQVKEIFQIVSYNAFRDGIVSISNYLTTQSSSIIASLFLGLTQTGVYSISLQFANAVAGISSAMINAYQPTLQSAYVNRDRDLEIEIVSRGMSVLYFLMIVGTICVCLFVFPILSIIKPDTSFSVPVYGMLSLYIFLWQQQAVSAAYISNTNQVPYAWPFVVCSILGVLLTVVTLKFTDLGIWSLIICPGFIQLLFNNWYWLYSVMRRLETNLVHVLLLGSRYWINVVSKKI